MTTRQLNIKNRTYYFYNDLINNLSFEANHLKIHKKTFKDIDIYYIGYVDKQGTMYYWTHGNDCSII